MKWFQRTVGVSAVLLLLYLIKSEVGINISQRYHAIDLVRIPAKFVLNQWISWQS